MTYNLIIRKLTRLIRVARKGGEEKSIIVELPKVKVLAMEFVEWNASPPILQADISKLN